MKAAKRAARRVKILEEIVTSERVYVNSLSTLRKVYLVPLRTVAALPAGKGQIFSHEELGACCAYVHVHVQCVYFFSGGARVCMRVCNIHI